MMLSLRAPALCRSRAFCRKTILTSPDSRRPVYCQLLVEFLLQVPAPPLPPYNISLPMEELVNLLGSRNQIRSCLGNVVSVLTRKYSWGFTILLCYTVAWREFMVAVLPSPLPCQHTGRRSLLLAAWRRGVCAVCEYGPAVLYSA